LKTDSLFYLLFQTAPDILFDVLGRLPAVENAYDFCSVELKQTAFRMDGVFVPRPEANDSTVYFVEVQFQEDEFFYQRFFAEIFLYLRQNPAVTQWQAAVLFSNRRIEPSQTSTYTVLLDSPQVQRIYLEDLQQESEVSIGVGLVQLIVSKPRQVAVRAKSLLDRLNTDEQSKLSRQAIIELIETIVVYQFPLLSREAIEQMLELSELKQTRVYQDALQEGIELGIKRERSLILKLLTCRVGSLSAQSEAKLMKLSVTQLEALGEALLNFSSAADLQDWLTKVSP
jgi:predicted transposase/invertase (TIGR01784 family)